MLHLPPILLMPRKRVQLQLPFRLILGHTLEIKIKEMDSMHVKL